MGKFMAIILLFFGLPVAGQPTLKGGLTAFINSHIVYPAYSWQNCIQGKINVSFKLNKQGEVYASHVSDGPGVDLDEEALRLIRLSSGKWIVPADYDTSYVVVAPVNFTLSGDDCTGKSPAEMQKAIAVYKANEGLTDAITNFYRNKEKGKDNTGEESRIIALKQELGYNDEFLQSKIKEGEKKLRQKDTAGACEDFLFVKYMGSPLADELLKRYCK
jgi:TonB family protein